MTRLEVGDERAVYRNRSATHNHKRLQMFVHAERCYGSHTPMMVIIFLRWVDFGTTITSTSSVMNAGGTALQHGDRRRCGRKRTGWTPFAALNKLERMDPDSARHHHLLRLTRKTNNRVTTGTLAGEVSVIMTG